MSENIGTKIKNLRESAGLTIEEIAEAASVSPAQITLIEKGGATPAIGTLIKISRRMGVRVGTLLDGTENSGAAVSTASEGISLSRANNLGAESDHLDYVSLGQGKPDRAMEPYVVNIDYKAGDSTVRSSHEGEEFIFVLVGEVEIRYGSDVYRLGVGDSIYYDSIVPHVVSSAAPGTQAKILAVTYTPY